MKNLLLLGLGIGCVTTGFSQTPERKWNFGLHGGLTQYNGDRGQNFYSTEQAAYGFGSISISRYLVKHLDLTFFMTKGEVGNIEPTNPGDPTPAITGENHFRARLNTANLALRFNMAKPEAAVNPYLYAGAAVIMYERIYMEKERWDVGAPSFGGGLKFRLSDVVSLQIQESFIYTNMDDIDKEVQGNYDGWLYHTAGLTFNLGEKKDEDKDGVSDKNDKCPSTPIGVSVDKNGCPNDFDKDRVADYQDECPDVAGEISLKGCPDKDKDGIADKTDRCPDVAGPTKLQGCPDADADGVADIDDKCADTKSNYKVDATGCPMDNDKDGVLNEDDRCADVAGIQALKGCPDRDGDGVADIDDRCPGTKGTFENKGCPEIAKEDVKRITVIASKIFFEFNSDKLKPESHAQLDALVEILNRYEGANLIIEGHTDNVGDDTYNMDLSQRRMDSVRGYLVSKGIAAARLTAKGYGETKPIADNKTAAGRTKNRRVELKTSY